MAEPSGGPSHNAEQTAPAVTGPVVGPEHEQPLVCALCHKTADKPNSVWIHLQNCEHCLHVDCLALARNTSNSNPNRKLDLHCPTCQVPSVRTMAWPGPFLSAMAKQDIFGRQLAEFQLAGLQPDTQFAVVQVAENIFTIDFGGPSVVTIDTLKDQDGHIFYYD